MNSTKNSPAQPLPNLEPYKPAPARTPATDELERHSRKCAICNHPERDIMEEAYLDWENPNVIASELKLTRHAVLRHMTATGLSAERSRRVRVALERVVERCSYANVTPRDVFRAIELHSHLSEDGRWIEPDRRRRMTVVHAYPEADAAAPLPSAARPELPAAAAACEGEEEAKS